VDGQSSGCFSERILCLAQEATEPSSKGEPAVGGSDQGCSRGFKEDLRQPRNPCRAYGKWDHLFPRTGGQANRNTASGPTISVDSGSPPIPTTPCQWLPICLIDGLRRIVPTESGCLISLTFRPARDGHNLRPFWTCISERWSAGP